MRGKMRFDGLDSFLGARGGFLTRGPVALIFFEDGVEADSTLLHHLRLGFARILAFTPEGLDLPMRIGPEIVEIKLETRAAGAVPAAVNRIALSAPDMWFYWGYNAEYLFFPFCDTRALPEMLAFHAEERRDAMHCFVLDLYADDLGRWPDGVCLSAAHFDARGYFAHSGANSPDGSADRLPQIHGGLRWRFDDHLRQASDRLDRIAVFRSQAGLRMLPDHSFSDVEYNTISCPWHRNLTAAICSFRAAKALRSNPGSRRHVAEFRWRGSERFSWTPQQLLDLGMMEAGQWF